MADPDAFRSASPGLPRSGLLRRGGALTGLAGGNALAALVTLGAQPVLARLFSPAEFGVAETFAALLALAFPVASLRYEDALVLPESDDDARAVWHVALGLTLGAVALVALAPLAAPLAMDSESGRALAPFLWLFAPGLFALRAQRLADAWLVRQRRFGSITAATVARSVTTSAWRLAAGVLGQSGGLVTGFVGGNAAAVVVQARALVRSGLFAARPSWTAMRRVAVRYRRFALYTTPSTLLAALSSRLPLLALAALFPLDVVGHLGRVLLVVATPLGFVGGALSRVLTADGAAAHRAGTLAPLALRTHALHASVGLWPCLALMVAGPDAFEVVFGAAWREAGEYARLTAPWFVLASHAATLSPLFDLTERHRRDLASTLALFAGMALALVVAAVLDASAPATIALLGAVGAALRIAHIAVLLRVAGVTAGAALRSIWPSAVTAAVALVPVAVAVFRGAPPLAVVALLAVSGLAYAAVEGRRWRRVA